MKRHLGIVVLVLLALVALLLLTVTYVVDQTKDIVLITTFGKVTKVVDGRQSGRAGLHVKWPWPIQRVVRYDSREHTLSSSSRQLQIGEKLNVVATIFCVWRIEDPERLYRTKETVEKADEALKALLASEMSGVLGKVNMGELVNTDPQRMRLAEIDEKILQRVDIQARRDYGIALNRVGGLKVLVLPQAVTKAVIDTMNEERNEEVTRYQAEGQATAEAITGRATAARDKILAFAQRKAGDIRAEGNAKAAEAYAKFQEDPEFGMFLRSLETLRAALAQRTVLVLDSDMMPILRWLWERPSLETFKDSGTKRR
jgi:membrane protease subunit HflC